MFDSIEKHWQQANTSVLAPCDSDLCLPLHSLTSGNKVLLLLTEFPTHPHFESSTQVPRPSPQAPFLATLQPACPWATFSPSKRGQTQQALSASGREGHSGRDIEGTKAGVKRQGCGSCRYIRAFFRPRRGSGRADGRQDGGVVRVMCPEKKVLEHTVEPVCVHARSGVCVCVCV